MGSVFYSVFYFLFTVIPSVFIEDICSFAMSKIWTIKKYKSFLRPRLRGYYTWGWETESTSTFLVALLENIDGIFR